MRPSSRAWAEKRMPSAPPVTSSRRSSMVPPSCTVPKETPRTPSASPLSASFTLGRSHEPASTALPETEPVQGPPGSASAAAGKPAAESVSAHGCGPWNSQVPTAPTVPGPEVSSSRSKRTMAASRMAPVTRPPSKSRPSTWQGPKRPSNWMSGAAAGPDTEAVMVSTRPSTRPRRAREPGSQSAMASRKSRACPLKVNCEPVSRTGVAPRSTARAPR